MNKKSKVSSLLIAAFAVVIAPVLNLPVSAQNTVDSQQRFIVTFHNKINDHTLNAIQNAGASSIKQLDLINGVAVTIPTVAAAKKLQTLENVKRVEVDARVYITANAQRCSPWPACKSTTTTEPSQVLPWGVDRIDADKSWTTSRGAGVKVAVIDTGIDKTHPDLAGNIGGGVNFVESGRGANKTIDPNNWNDDNNHGSHVAGTIAAIDNTEGVVGVAPQAKVYAVKVLDSTGNGYASDVIKGVEWSINNGMQVINMSLAEDYHIQALQDAVDRADQSGIVVVAAAANIGDGDASTNNVLWPAKYASTIAVSATDSNNVVASFSSDGEEVEIAAPGVSIYSTIKSGGYGTMSGTSMATPHVAGVVAAMLAAPVIPSADTNMDGKWNSSEVRAYLQMTTDDLGVAGRDVFYGYGLVDAEEAITGAVSQ